MSDKPFGVNLTFLPALTPPDYPASAKAIVETAGRNPEAVLPVVKDAGIKIIHKGLAYDTPTCQEPVDRIMSEAEQIINERLVGFLKG